MKVKFALVMFVMFLELTAFGIEDDEAPVNATVKRIISTENGEHVILSAGENAGYVQGQVLDIFRMARDRQSGETFKVVTGRVKLIKVDRGESMAFAVEDGTNISHIYFGKFSKMMAQDFAEIPKVEIVNATVITPQMNLSFFDTFIDPKSNPATYELSDQGKTSIRQAAELYANAKVSTLLIEGHTDKIGPSSSNQVESYQRALAIRQYMIDELGFDSERVVAVGLGESETLDDNHIPGYERIHRRISFKLLNSDELH